MGPQFQCWSYYWKKSGDRAIVQFTGKELRLDDEGVGSLADELGRLGRPELCLDFRHVESVNNSSRGMLRKLLKGLRAAGYRLRLYGLSPRRSPVAVPRRDRLFDIRR